LKKLITPISNHLKLTITVPGSKSLTHRALITAALAKGHSTLENILLAEDTLLTTEALRQMGVKIDISNTQAVVQGIEKKLIPPKRPVYLGNSGTSMRLLTAICAIGQGRFVLTGNERMQQRPIQPLLDALNQWGVKAYSERQNGCPPVVIETQGLNGGKTEIDPTISSQFLSGLLLAAPYGRKDSVIEVKGKIASLPYVDLTIDVMEKFGISVKNLNYKCFEVKKGHYQACQYTIEGDCSTASYFWAAAAILKGEVTVRPIAQTSKQADIGFVNVLKKMGCQIIPQGDGIKVIGRNNLRGITVDMNKMPDVVPTLAVVAAFAKGETVINNVGHLRVKECDRLQAVATELKKMGIEVKEKKDGLIIKGGQPQGAEIETYNDHRIAMSFAIAGLKVPGIIIRNPDCVKKSFPGFWETGLFK